MSDSFLRFPRRGATNRGPARHLSLVGGRPEAVLPMLGRGALTQSPDVVFDRWLAEPMRHLSAQHWTPLAVVTRAAQWLDDCNVRTVVDIGSGAGKFCVAAAVASRCHFTGLEQRGHLVASARMLARTFGVEDRTYFIHGALGEVRLPSVDAYYLFNPFEENLMAPTERIDESVGHSRERFNHDLEVLRGLLARAPAGTYVLIYNGFGGSLPDSYSRIRTDNELPNPLCLWRKSASRLIGRSHRSCLSSSAGTA